MLCQDNNGNLVVGYREEGSKHYSNFIIISGKDRGVLARPETSLLDDISLEDLAKETASSGIKNAMAFAQKFKQLGYTIEQLSNFMAEDPNKYFNLVRLIIVANGGVLRLNDEEYFFLWQGMGNQYGIGTLGVAKASKTSPAIITRWFRTTFWHEINYALQLRSSHNRNETCLYGIHNIYDLRNKRDFVRVLIQDTQEIQRTPLERMLF